MKLSYSAAWDDATALLKAHGALIVALAGVFLLLPTLLVGYLVPPPAQAKDFAELIPRLNEYWVANWGWFAASALVRMLGSLAILFLVFAPGGTSVGTAIVRGGALLPFYLLAVILMSVAISFGILLLILPGLYLAARLAPLGPVMVAEGRRSPIDAFGRTFEVTKGNGWRILGFLCLVAIAAYVAAGVLNMVSGILFVLIAGKSLGPLLAMIVASATSSAIAILFLLLNAAIYRQLAGPAAASAAVFD